MPGTLQHFLSKSLQADVKASLVPAVELDPAILAAALCLDASAAHDLANWHEPVNEALLQAIAIAMTSAAVVRPVSVAQQDRWYASLRRSQLAAAMAARVYRAGVTECRLTALLSGVGEWLDLPEGAPDTDVAAAGADFLQRLGCSANVCDAVRYQYEPAGQLKGTSLLMRVNAVATVLLAHTDGSATLPRETVDAIRDLLELDEEAIDDLMGRASRSLQLSIELLEYAPADREAPAADCLSATVTNANIGAAFYRALMKSGGEAPFATLVNRTGRFLFGFREVCYFRFDEGELVSSLGERETARLDVNVADSAIVESYRRQMIAVVAKHEASALIERQLMNRFASDWLLCTALSAEAGVLVCAVDAPFANNLDHHRPLLSAFADAAADLFAREGDEASGATVAVDQVRRRVREITHEVNNPLAIVQNYLRSLSLKLGEDTPLQKDIDAISRELMRVAGIVQKYGQIGNAEELIYQGVQLNRLIEELLDIVKGGANISVETHFDESIPVLELAADALRQVLLNLMKNAVEALKEVPEPHIVVSTQGAVNVGGRHYLEIVITDNGRGMSAEQRLELFNKDATSKGEGRGLGLGIVKALLDDMSGIISCREDIVDAEPGTSFQIFLPLGHEPDITRSRTDGGTP